MSKRIRVMTVFGTRPEAIKLAPIILQLQSRPQQFDSLVCVTAQHREMLDQVLDIFDIKPRYDLNIMETNQTLEYLTGQIVQSVAAILKKEHPDVVLVQGDTTTTFAASLASFYCGTKVAHVEAGLRTWDKSHPFPEEINRRLTSALTDFHFAPTDWAKTNLVKEGYKPENVYVVGNPIVDALLFIKERTKDRRKEIDVTYSRNRNKVILVTAHRRESFGKQFEDICNALCEIAERPDVEIVYPVHLNPSVREPVYSILGSKSNIHLIEPLGYEKFISLMDNCYLILTDSGGIQEEAPSLKKPVLIMRETSERPGGIQAGIATLVGTRVETIVQTVCHLLDNKVSYQAMISDSNPYGDGKSAARIVDILSKLITVRS